MRWTESITKTQILEIAGIQQAIAAAEAVNHIAKQHAMTRTNVFLGRMIQRTARSRPEWSFPIVMDCRNFGGPASFSHCA
jgi:hypothetical protein